MEQTVHIKKQTITNGGLIFFYWAPVILWMGIIFFFSSRHSVSVSEEYILNFLFFKLLHLIEYAVLFTLFSRAINRSNRGAKVVNSNAVAFVLTIIYAMTDELHQWFVPSRSPQPRDVIIDAIGAGLVWIYLSTQLPKAPGVLKKLARILDMPL